MLRRALNRSETAKANVCIREWLDAMAEAVSDAQVHSAPQHPAADRQIADWFREQPAGSASDTEIAAWFRGQPADVTVHADWFRGQPLKTASDADIAGWFRGHPASSAAQEVGAAAEAENYDRGWFRGDDVKWGHTTADELDTNSDGDAGAAMYKQFAQQAAKEGRAVSRPEDEAVVMQDKASTASRSDTRLRHQNGVLNVDELSSKE